MIWKSCAAARLFWRTLVPETGMSRTSAAASTTYLISSPKYLLDICPYGNVISHHASRNHNFRRLQRRRRTSSPRNFELSRAAGTSRRRHRRHLGLGAAFSLQASPRPKRCGPGQRAPRWSPYALSHQRRGHPPASRMGGHLRTPVAKSVGTRQRTRRGRNEKVSRITTSKQKEET